MAIRNFKHHRPNIGHATFVDPSAQVIGRVNIGNDCSIWPLTTIRGDVNSVNIGHNTNIQDNSVLHVTHDHPASPPGGYPLSIGDNVTIGHGVILHGCSIGNNCLIGMGSRVLDGAVIDEMFKCSIFSLREGPNKNSCCQFK